MQIVINIDDEDYDDITLTGENTINLGVLLDLREAVRKGTPLPKGHRFIDADEILNHAFITEDEECDAFTQKYYCIEKEVMDKALVLFDTLEADGVEE